MHLIITKLDGSTHSATLPRAEARKLAARATKSDAVLEVLVFDAEPRWIIGLADHPSLRAVWKRADGWLTPDPEPTPDPDVDRRAEVERAFTKTQRAAQQLAKRINAGTTIDAKHLQQVARSARLHGVNLGRLTFVGGEGDEWSTTSRYAAPTRSGRLAIVTVEQNILRSAAKVASTARIHYTAAPCRATRQAARLGLWMPPTIYTNGHPRTFEDLALAGDRDAAAALARHAQRRGDLGLLNRALDLWK